MKSTDLRIGNLVFDDGYGMDIKVKAEDLLCIVSLKPIPLTEEWYIRLGFKKEYHEDEFPENGYYFTFDFFDNVYEDLALMSSDDKTKVELFPFSKEYSFVHEVQNLVHSLLGKEIHITIN